MMTCLLPEREGAWARRGTASRGLCLHPAGQRPKRKEGRLLELFLPSVAPLVSHVSSLLARVWGCQELTDCRRQKGVP